MRMGINEFSAKDAINNLDEKELAQIFKFFGDEKDSNRIAHNIVEDRATREITTEELKVILNKVKIETSIILVEDKIADTFSKH